MRRRRILRFAGALWVLAAGACGGDDPAASTDAGADGTPPAEASIDASPDASPPLTCGNGVHDGDESDVDCGGATCGPCANGKACALPSDCVSGACTATKCAPWAKRFGAANGNDVFLGVAVARDGAIAATGYSMGPSTSVDFGGTVVARANGVPPDIMIVKLTPQGGTVWAKGVGGSSAELGTAIAFDAAGDVIVVGQTPGTGTGFDFGCKNLVANGNVNPFVAKLDGATGACKWSNLYGSAAPALLRNVAIDANDDVIIAGTTAASLDLGKGGTTYVAGNDVFVAKLSGVDGTTTWSVGYGSTLTEVVNGLALDATGNPVISGYFGAPFSFGGNPGLPKVGPAGTSDGFVAKLSAAAGAPIWSVGFGTAADDAVGSVAIDQTTGDVFVVGTSNGPLDVGGGPFPDPSPNPLVFVSKRNGATGAHTWSTSFTVGGSIVIDGLTLDAPGNPVIGGHFGGGTLKLAGVTKPLVGTFDAFIGRFDKTSKAELGVQTFSGAGASVFMGALAVASKTGNLVVAGNFQPTVDMGSGITLTSSGGSDMFLGSLGPQ